MASNSVSGNRPLEGKLAIVTGGARGIGAAIANNLARKGCNLVVNYASDSSRARAIELCKTLSEAEKIVAVPFQADLGKPEDPASLVSFAKSRFATPERELRIDIIVNNAGVAGGGPVSITTPEEFHRLYNVNVLGPLLLVKAALPYLPHDRSGRIVNVSSVSSSGGYEGHSIYGGTKAALEAMTRTWARELRARATVNAVNPGPVDTEMYAGHSTALKEKSRPYLQVTPLAQVEGEDWERLTEEQKREVKEGGGRMAKPDEIAGVVGMLCGAESAWCTGSVVCANGGMIFTR